MRQLNAQDASMLFAESASTPNHVSSIEVFDTSASPRRPVTLEDILRHLESRVAMARTTSERLISVPLGLDLPYWVTDPDFDLELHVRSLTLPAPGNWKQFMTVVSQLHSQPIDLSRPPWELYLVEGLDSMPALPRGGFGVVLKIHHAAIDGMAGAELVNVLHDPSPDTRPVAPKIERAGDTVPSPWSLLGTAVFRTATSPVRLLDAVGRALPRVGRVVGGVRRNELTMPTERAPSTRFNATPSGHLVVDGRLFPLAEVKRMKGFTAGATVNDVALTIVGGALRTYLLAKEELPDEPLTAMMPISVRPSGETPAGGNQVSGTVVSLSTDVADPVERLAAIRERTSQGKDFAEALGARTLTQITEALPGALLGLGLRAAARFSTQTPLAANTVVTNVPGARTPMYLCGAKLNSIYGAGPVIGRLGLVHIISSYCDDFYISVTSCREMLPDIDFYMECIEHSFDELRNSG